MVEDIEEVLLDQERSKGFDPLGLTKDPDQYFKLREAEIKVRNVTSVSNNDTIKCPFKNCTN